jgi:tRNA threonylcarbamoyladenosine biosynthesis protein TsaB
MKILAFDTATPATTVALCGAGGGDPLCDKAGTTLEARDDPEPGRRPGHATRLMPLAVGLLDRAGVAWEDLDRIAVGVGPGTFTGLRIGIATARALARARSIPLTGVSTLQSLALNARAAASPSGTVLAVIDARRREVFVAGWSRDELSAANGALLRPRVIAPEALSELFNGLPLPILAIGDGALAFREVLERSGALVPEVDSELHRVTAINHCELARYLPAEAPEQVVPSYMRLPDAEIARRTASTQ